jgi:hypothetical protein
MCFKERIFCNLSHPACVYLSEYVLRQRLFKLTRAGLKELDELHRINAALWQDYPQLSPEEHT